MSDTTVAPSPKHRALTWLVKNSPITVASYTELGNVFGWERAKTWKVIQEWKRKGYVETETAPDTGRLTVTVIPNVVPIDAFDGATNGEGDAGNDSVREGATPLPAAAEARFQPAVPTGKNGSTSKRPTSVPAVDTVYATYVPRPYEAVRWAVMTALDVLAVLAAIFLTGIAAVLSVSGMIVLFPGIPVGAGCLGAGIEACKLTAAAWIGHRWRDIGWGSRLALIVLVACAAAFNAIGVYGQLVEGHVGPRSEQAAGLETRDAQAAARIETALGRLADVDRRLSQIDAAVEGAAKKGKANTAVNVMKEQQKTRAALAAERERVAKEVADLKADRAGAMAKGRAITAETVPIRYVAELFGVQRGDEEVSRWFIAGLVGCGDPFAIILLGLSMGRRRRAA